jgi:hypothetical protein
MIVKINQKTKILLVELSKLYECEFAIIVTIRVIGDDYIEKLLLTCSKLGLLYNDSGETNREFESIDELTKFLNYLKEKQ